MKTRPDDTANSEPSEFDAIFSTRLWYACVGAAGGLAFFVWTLLQPYGRRGNGEHLISSLPEMTSAEHLAIMAASIVFGALVGVELHSTRKWGEPGGWRTLARWTFASLSGAATVGSVFLMLHRITWSDYWSILGFAAALGFAVGFRIVWDEPEEDAGTTASSSDRARRK